MAFPNSARSAGSANAANTRSDRRGTGPLENKGRVLQILGFHGTFLIRESMELCVGAAAWRDGLQAEFRACCRLADDCDMQPVASSHIWLAFAKRFFGTEDERFQSLGLSHQPHYDVVPNQRIVSSETVETARKKLIISMSTTTLQPQGASTKVTVTTQLISLAGDDMINGVEVGQNASLR
jgi:hypothetical protein